MNYNNFDITKINFTKGLVPGIIQDSINGEVLMLGYLNQESLQKSLKIGKVTFYSRSKKRLWTKGETSGNTLKIQSIYVDCENDSLLFIVKEPKEVCHLKRRSYFGNSNYSQLKNLENVIKNRLNNPNKDSYTSKIANLGINKIAQKVGEKGVETALAGINENNDRLLNESADLIYHLLILLNYRNLKLDEILRVLMVRDKKTNFCNQKSIQKLYNFPLNPTYAQLLQILITLFKMNAAQKSFMRRKWRGMSRLQNQMLALIYQNLFGYSKVSPKHKNQIFSFLR